MEFMNEDLIRHRHIPNRVIERTCSNFDVNKKYWFGSNDSNIDIKFFPGFTPPYMIRFPFNISNATRFELCGPMVEFLKFVSIHLKSSITLSFNKSINYDVRNLLSISNLYINEVIFL